MRTRQRMSGSDRKTIKASKHYSNIMESQHEEDIDIHKPEKNPPAYGAVLPQTFVDNYRIFKEYYDKREKHLKEAKESKRVINFLEKQLNRISITNGILENYNSDLEDKEEELKTANYRLQKDVETRDSIILSLKTELANKQDSFDKQNENHTVEILLMKTDMVSILQRMRDSVERGCLYIKKHNIDFNELIEEVSSL